MYKAMRRARLNQSEIAGLEAAIARLWAAVGPGTTAPRVTTFATSPQGALDCSVPTICLVTTSEGIQTYRNTGTGINGWES
jgi:hypothetical protein